jgi:dTDP-4-amino-4,6-dideoxygalactose transaminase
VHLFGIPEDMERVAEIAKKHSIFVIEDAAQAMGSSRDRRPAGSMGDISVVSFNKGKNLPALTGGAFLTDRKELAVEAEKIYPENGTDFLGEIKAAVKSAAVSLLSRPFFYGAFYSVTGKFREVPASVGDITPGPMPKVNRRLAVSLLKRSEVVFNVRRRTGALLLSKLDGTKGIILPRPDTASDIVFNRLPVLVKNEFHRELIKNRLFKKGIESNYYYKEPFYFKRKSIPENALYFSRHLLTLPANIFMKDEQIKTATKIFREV